MHADLEAHKPRRLKAPTRYGRPRKPASVNRELAMMQSALGFAARQGWLSGDRSGPASRS